MQRNVGFGLSDLSEDQDQAESHPEGAAGRAGPTCTNRTGPKSWSVVVLSVLGSAVAVAAVGCVCALIYPILKELRAERVTGEDGAEHRMLGFWSILVLSLIAGCICCAFSWTLTYLDSYQPGLASGTLLTLAHLRGVSSHRLHIGYGVAVLNGVMGMLTVIWSLT
ncbi:ADP-ribosylation factor-like protein 6-interacting protein 6 [Epinephelus lanceolatus]|uniref:ADP-ribosylation factor-like protein 6-interacting protein 6 n=1 Tax=Epinephelus lanceolatus TaxID=310571 RepID=UPI0014485055|nr:ADP-ribosylation factor-like protein 6-interacting protein 6 [Epinephelus lanceolatus]